MARSSLESIPQALSKLGVEGRRVSTFDYREAAVRRQGWSNRDGTHAGESTSLTDYPPDGTWLSSLSSVARLWFKTAILWFKSHTTSQTTKEISPCVELRG